MKACWRTQDGYQVSPLCVISFTFRFRIQFDLVTFLIFDVQLKLASP